MNIAFDGIAIFGPGSQNRGIGNYTISQLSEMVRQDPKNKYYIFNMMEHTKSLEDYLGREAAEKITLIDCYCGKDHFMTRNPDYADLIGEMISSFIDEYSIDLFYITTPFDGNMMCYRREWFGSAVTAATVYDIIPYVMPENFFVGPNAELARSRYEQRVELIRSLDKVLTISECVKNDLLNYFDFDPEQIEVIYAGVDTVYRKQQYTEEQKEALYNKFHINKPYIICTGGKDARKNIDGLIIGYSKADKEVRDRYQLVIVGKLSEEAIEGFMKIAKDHNVEESVVFTNFVTSDELVMLNNLAVLAAFPSKYEGFGLPVVEAWACGTPVLTSNNSSLAEIAEQAAILVDPTDPEDIGRGFTYAFMEADLDKYAQSGEDRLARFSWEKVASDTIRALDQAEKDRNLTGDSSDKCSLGISDEYMRKLIRQIGRQEIYPKNYSQDEIIKLTATLSRIRTY